ncbi:MAG: trigger factor [Chloroflexi bacterium]|nr:trigger factor [Chloroflexota bacterium]
MKISKEEHPPREVVLKVELESEDLEPYLDRAYRKVVQRAKIAGFRQGKAPRQIVERFLGREHLMHEALEFLVPEVTDRAITQEGLELGAPPHMELESTDPVTIKATVPLIPLVEMGDYRAVRVPFEQKPVTDEDVAGVVEGLRQEVAPWEPVERPVQYGDLVNLKVHGSASGQAIVDNDSVDYLTRENDKNPVPGFSEALLGLEAGGSKEFTINVPQEFGNRALAGRECQFSVTMNSVKAKRLPELDDEFARSVGQGYESLEALKARVQQDLSRQAEREARERHQEQVVEAVVKEAKVELSPLMVEHEVDRLFQEQQETLRRQRMSMEQYLGYAGKTAEEIRTELQPAAEARLRRAAVLTEVARLEGIESREEDAQQEIESMAKRAGAQEDAVRRLFDSAAARDSLRRALWSGRVQRRLAHIASDGAVPEEEEAPETTSEEAKNAEPG